MVRKRQSNPADASSPPCNNGGSGDGRLHYKGSKTNLLGLVAMANVMGIFIGLHLQPASNSSLLSILHSQLKSPTATQTVRKTEALQAISLPTTCLDLQLTKNMQDRYRPSPQETSKCLLYEKPSPYIDLLMKAMVGFPNMGRCNGNCKGLPAPFDAQLRQYGNDWPPYGFSMIGNARMENFRAAILEVHRQQVPGAIVELGVWRGGAMIMAAALCQELDSPRDLYVLDAFEEIPKATYGNIADYLFNSEADVRANFDLFQVNSERVHFVKGLFKNTVPTLGGNFSNTNSNSNLQHVKPLDQIAVLRVDGNFYDSYQDAMYYLYDKVPVGGIVIFDDVMSHPAVLQFWNDFKSDQQLPETLNRIDLHSTWFRKQADIKVDMTKMKPPRDVNIA